MSHRLLDPVTQVELIVPDGISDADAIKHAALRRAGKLRRLRLSPEWGTGCFLFSDGGGADPEHFNITPNMADRLRNWAGRWEELGNPFTECTDLDVLDTWCQQGLTLAIELQRELYMTTVVVPEFGGLRGSGWEFSQPMGFAASQPASRQIVLRAAPRCSVRSRECRVLQMERPPWNRSSTITP